MKFNLIGFNFSPKLEYKHCAIHPGSRLVQKIDDPDMLWCPTCGTSYSIKETGTDEKIKSRFGPNAKSKIISPKPKIKYYDSQGNEITDETLIQDIMRGANVIYYREDKPEGSSQTNSNSNRKIRN